MNKPLDQLTLRDSVTMLEKLEPALKLAGETHSLRDLWVSLERGERQLWMHEGSVAITEIVATPNVKTCHIWLAGGELDALQEHILPEIESWAEMMHCDRVSIAGRRGWERTLAGKGYGHRITYLTKELA